jgi:uncharacterized membrane protein
MVTMLQNVLVLAHCGAKWWLCDGGSVVGGVGFLAFMIIGLKRMERRAEARAAELRRARGYPPK